VTGQGALAAAAGLAGLLAAGACVAGTAYVAGIWRDVTRPPRRGMGWALGQGIAASPADLGLDFEERTVDAPGTSMPCWWITGRGPADEVTVLLHGHGRSRWDSLRRVPGLADRAGLVVLPDLRAHGDAPGRSSLARREAADVCALLAEIERERPGARITLAGHSLGAVVAIHAAAQREQAGAPLRRVVAWGPYERVRTPFETRLRLRGLPAGPFAGIVLAALERLDGPELPTSASAARLHRTELEIHADELDAVSPLRDAHAIAAARPGARVHASRGVAHADLGVPGASGVRVQA
jgi:pimeloyl-ACP methyl ester carboxylesterase